VLWVLALSGSMELGSYRLQVLHTGCEAGPSLAGYDSAHEVSERVRFALQAMKGMGLSKMSTNGWEKRGKTVRGLIQELQTFENQDLKVEIAFQPGGDSFPISLIGNDGGKCILFCLAGRSEPGME